MKFKEIKRWSIYRASLDPVIGSEQGKSRPVLIISENAVNEVLNTVNIIPITSRKIGRKIYPNEALINASSYGLENESILLCHQIRTIDKQRLSYQYGQITDNDKQQETLEALCFQLVININI
ncbi:type II toxin-antitoxin system PemK/MazF family toxin [bacterium]|nr:MAG: type II toxin-antitoxin system PemK/MazF family toxin [bacterium]